MRILVVCQYYYPENVAISPLCEDLVKRGHEVFVVTGKPNYGFGRILPGYERISDETIKGVQIHRVNLKPRKKSRWSLIQNYLSFWRNSRRYLAHLHRDFDVVYGMSMSPLIGVEGGIRFAKKHKIPSYIHCLDLWPESAVIAGKIRKGSLAYRLLYSWSRRIYQGCDGVLISSPSFADYFQTVLKLPEKKLIYVPQPPLVSSAPSEPVVYSKPKNIVYAGNIGNLQLIEQYVEACARLRERKDFQFHIIGNGSRLSAVQEIIRREHLEDIVVYHPPVSANEVSGYFTNATALVVSLAESISPVSKTIPNKLISSLYYGKPIIASIGGDGKRILEETGGSLISSENPAEIASMMKKLFSLDEKTLQTMGESNRRYFDEHFQFDRIMDQLEKSLNPTV